MAFLNDRNLLTKLAIPLAVLVLVVGGIVWFARAELDTLAQDAGRIVDIDVARLNAVLKLNADVNEASVQEKGLILYGEGDRDKMVSAEKVYRTYRDEALKGAEYILTLPDTDQNRKQDEAIFAAVEYYFSLLDKTITFALEQEDARALAISNGEGRNARMEVRRLLRERIETNRKTLEAAKNGASALAASTGRNLIVAAFVGVLAALGLLAAMTILGIVRPISEITAAMGRLAGGDLDVEVIGVERKDEVGSLARALAVFRDNAVEARRLAAEREVENEAKARRASALEALTKEFEGKVSILTKGLSGAAAEMEATAESMTQVAERTNTTTMTAAGAAAQTSTNVQTVAVATEELTASIREIVTQVGHSSRISDRAVADAAKTGETIRTLSDTADRIGDVVGLIKTIAGQTNLLALNATIEAARAGDVGKGFAVVASEVKTLAGQTAKATEEIAAQVAAVQGATRQAVEDIERIGRTIAEMSQISVSIASAMEEQESATAEIARNVQQAAVGTEQVSEGIGAVRQDAGDTGAAATQVLGAAKELAVHSGSLSLEVNGFLNGVSSI